MPAPSPPEEADPLADVLRRAEGGDDEAIRELQTFADAEVLRRCATSKSPRLLHIVATHADTSDGVLVSLASTPDLALQLALLERDTLPEEALTRLAEVDALFFRVLARLDCPASLLEQAGESNEPEVQRIVAGHPSTPVHTLDAIAQRTVDAQVEELLWQRGIDDDPNRLGTLASAMDPDVRARVARSKATPIPVLARLSHDTDDEVRMAVAARGDLPARMALDLATDGVADVARAARANPAVRLRRLIRLAALVLVLVLVGLAVAAALLRGY